MSRISTSSRLAIRDFRYSLRFGAHTNDVINYGTLSGTIGITYSYCVWATSFGVGNTTEARLFNKGVDLIRTHNDGSGKVTVTHNATTVTSSSATPWLKYDKKWHFYVVTFDGTNLKFYRDGSLIETLPIGDSPVDTGNAFTVGNRTSWSRAWQGSIGPHRLYKDRVLTLTEIQQLYYNAIEPSTTGLILHAKLFDGSGASVQDFSGAGNIGTITGATWDTSVPMKLRTSASNALQYAYFDGSYGSISISDNDVFSIVTTGELSISMWIRPDVLEFTNFAGSGNDTYVNFFGKTAGVDSEWVLRIRNYSASHSNRISCYVFNSGGHLGDGSSFQEAITPGQWIHVFATWSMYKTQIYKNGVFKSSHYHQTTGTPATATATVSGGAVTAINITAGGDTYLNTPYVNLYGGGGSGATAEATLTGGVVTDITITNPGSGYTSSPTVIIGINPSNTSSGLSIGKGTYSSNPGYFQGAIRDIKVFNRVLTASEAQGLYENDVTPSGLVAKYLLSSDVTDSSGNGLNGTNSGATFGSDDRRLSFATRTSA